MATSDLYQRPIEYCEATIEGIGIDAVNVTLRNPLGDVSRCSVLTDRIKDIVPVQLGSKFGMVYYDAIRFSAKFFPLKESQ